MVFVSWNVRNFLILEQESSISRKIGNLFRGRSFLFFMLGPKSAPGSPIIYYVNTNNYVKEPEKKYKALYLEEKKWI